MTFKDTLYIIRVLLAVGLVVTCFIVDDQALALMSAVLAWGIFTSLRIEDLEDELRDMTERLSDLEDEAQLADD